MYNFNEEQIFAPTKKLTLTSVFAYMGLALLITSVTAFGIYLLLGFGILPVSWYLPLLIGSTIGYFVTFIVINWRVLRQKEKPVLVPFIVYAVMMGIVLSSIMIYTAIDVILLAFGVSALLFGMMAAYGALTKRNLNAMSANSLIVPVLTSYVSAAPGYIPAAAVNAGIDVYTNAWVDILSEAGAAAFTTFTETVNTAITDEVLSATEALYALNPALVAFTIAGYVAADVFVTGLERVAANGEVLNWENYIAAMEESPVEFPLGGPIDFTGGKRLGLDSLSLLHAVYVAGDTPTVTLELAKPLETLDTILAK